MVCISNIGVLLNPSALKTVLTILCAMVHSHGVHDNVCLPTFLFNRQLGQVCEVLQKNVPLRHVQFMLRPVPLREERFSKIGTHKAEPVNCDGIVPLRTIVSRRSATFKAERFKNKRNVPRERSYWCCLETVPLYGFLRKERYKRNHLCDENFCVPLCGTETKGTIFPIENICSYSDVVPF